MLLADHRQRRPVPRRWPRRRRHHGSDRTPGLSTIILIARLVVAIVVVDAAVWQTRRLPPTVAAFSPSSPSGYSASDAKQRSTVIVRKKSPLLVATPPQITRALAHSHPFLLPLNRLAGLVTWTAKDPWESYLLVAAFWGIVLYGDFVLRFLTPLLIVLVLVIILYSRRYSPLSSASKASAKNSPESAEASSSYQSLDEILDDLTLFTARCNILLSPWISLTDFLSTQTTPTTATTRPALVTLFVRLLLTTPLWIVLTLPPFYILTSRRIIMFFGTTFLTWHSRPARVTRVLLWRSVFLRRLAGFVTGFDFSPQAKTESVLGSELTRSHSHLVAAALAKAVTPKASSNGVRFTFILYENQRRWIGLGWTTSMFAYERAPWTDEHLNPASSKEAFELPEVESGAAQWRWIPGSEWKLEYEDAKAHSRSASKRANTTKPGPKEVDDDGGGWTYYDSRWGDPRPADGWNRYTRRRKWYRDAELVGVVAKDPGTAAVQQAPAKSDANVPAPSSLSTATQSLSAPDTQPAPTPLTPQSTAAHSTATDLDPSAASKPASKRSGWLRRGRSDSKSSSSKNTQTSQISSRSRDDPQDDFSDKWRSDQDNRHRAFRAIMSAQVTSLNLEPNVQTKRRLQSDIDRQAKSFQHRTTGEWLMLDGLDLRLGDIINKRLPVVEEAFALCDNRTLVPR
ncbi:hypothetical protein DV737_g3109, partial [Chaetothyriales sp. CBS 132003]